MVAVRWSTRTGAFRPSQGKQQQQQQLLSLQKKSEDGEQSDPQSTFLETAWSRRPTALSSAGCRAVDVSASGAKVVNIRKIKKEAHVMKDGLLIVQADGNGLQYGEDIEKVIKSMKAVEGKGQAWPWAMVSIIKRHREDSKYEELQNRTNRKIHEELSLLMLE